MGGKIWTSFYENCSTYTILETIFENEILVLISKPILRGNSKEFRKKKCNKKGMKDVLHYFEAKQPNADV